jgi:hypothetical protein
VSPCAPCGESFCEVQRFAAEAKSRGEAHRPFDEERAREQAARKAAEPVKAAEAKAKPSESVGADAVVHPATLSKPPMQATQAPKQHKSVQAGTPQDTTSWELPNLLHAIKALRQGVVHVSVDRCRRLRFVLISGCVVMHQRFEFGGSK